MTDEKALRLMAVGKAMKMWAAFDENQRAAVRFGMFPAGPMQEAMKEGHDCRALSLALMDCAKADGGMVA